jgi:hypothetical protein
VLGPFGVLVLVLSAGCAQTKAFAKDPAVAVAKAKADVDKAVNATQDAKAKAAAALAEACDLAHAAEEAGLLKGPAADDADKVCDQAARIEDAAK